MIRWWVSPLKMDWAIAAVLSEISLSRWLRSNFKQQGSLALAVFITPFLAEKLVTM